MKIKVTGYIDSADLNAEYVDEGHDMGLSTEGYDALSSGMESFNISDLSDLRFVRLP